MRVPGQGSIRADGQFDRCELRQATWVVCVRLAVPRLGRLQKELALTARNVRRSVLRQYDGHSCPSCDCDNSNGVVLRTHLGHLQLVMTVFTPAVQFNSHYRPVYDTRQTMRQPSSVK